MMMSNEIWMIQPAGGGPAQNNTTHEKKANEESNQVWHHERYTMAVLPQIAPFLALIETVN